MVFSVHLFLWCSHFCNVKTGLLNSECKSAKWDRHYPQRPANRISMVLLSLKRFATMINTGGGKASAIGMLTNSMFVLGLIVTECPGDLP